ncbi:MAG: branched-chain amino acid transaminase [Anaerolineales bacterium]|nr:branched-chain amino acid transaminase [Chloroflexota bacterium]MBL6980468.1 branched-chain amino acid transaminase [Anaerolineales bacterium]
MESKYIWMNGELIPFEKATVHFLSPTIHYGFGVFEGARCYSTANGPAAFRLPEHLERFVDSAKIIGIQDFPYNVEELRDAVHETISANELSACYIRPALYMNGPLGLNADGYKTSVGIAVWEWGTYLGEDALEKGVRMAVSSLTRLHPNSFMTKAKAAGNYVNSIMAKTMAHRMGYDDAIMLDPEGYVAEGSGMNIFAVRDEVIYTPPRTTILEGITRDSVITLARDLGYTVVEERLVRDQLYIADEVFVCGTAAEVTAVSEIDTRTIGSGRMGPVTRYIQQAFFQTVRGEGQRSVEWLDYVRVMAPTII